MLTFIIPFMQASVEITGFNLTANFLTIIIFLAGLAGGMARYFIKNDKRQEASQAQVATVVTSIEKMSGSIEKLVDDSINSKVKSGITEVKIEGQGQRIEVVEKRVDRIENRQP
jgi:hypothetical protein